MDVFWVDTALQKYIEFLEHIAQSEQRLQVEVRTAKDRHRTLSHYFNCVESTEYPRLQRVTLVEAGKDEKAKRHRRTEKARQTPCGYSPASTAPS